MTKTLTVLQQVPDCQLQYTLLRSCLDACKVNHLLRATPFPQATAAVAGCTTAIRGTLESLINRPLTDPQWQQAALPVRYGGLGIGDPMLTRPFARISAMLDFLTRGQVTLGLPFGLDLTPRDFSATHTQLQDLLPGVPEVAILADSSQLPCLPSHARRQHWWLDQADRRWQQQLAADLPVRDRVRLMAQRQPHAGVWLLTLPSPALRTRVASPQWQCLLRWWLGVPILPDTHQGVPCPKCNTAMDCFGDHIVCCAKNDIQRRHVALQHSLAELIRDVGYPCELEKGFGDGSRAADILIPRWDSDGPAAVDVTIRCPLAPHNTVRDPSLLTKWQLQQESEKQRKYGDGCERMGWSFHPFVVDTFGALAPSARAFMAVLTKRAVGTRLGRERKGHEMSLWQRLLFPAMATVGRQLSALLTAPAPPASSSIATVSSFHRPYTNFSPPQ